jgi:hypothetical protein
MAVKMLADQKQMKPELEILFAVESVEQVKSGLDSIAGLGNVPAVLSPTTLIVRNARSGLFFSSWCLISSLASYLY